MGEGEPPESAAWIEGNDTAIINNIALYSTLPANVINQKPYNLVVP